jgi:hypothetical protein
MNTNGLAKHYDGLKPRERLALILAASARGDEQERDRLTQSAPKCSLRVGDHFAFSMAFREVSETLFMELLDHAAHYFHAMASADSGDGDAENRLLDAGLVFGYLFKTKLAGWRLFCREYALEPELLWTMLPGYETVRRAERMAESAAFTAEGVQRYFERKGWTDGELLTPEHVTAGLKDCFEARAEWWGD